MEWLAWWNLIFELPVLTACMLSMTAALGPGSEGHDAEHDTEVGHDAEVGHDLHADVDHDLHADVDHDLHADVDHDLHVENAVQFDLENEVHVEADVDHDLHADVDHDLHAEVGHDVEAHGDVEHDATLATAHGAETAHDTDETHSAGWMQWVLALPGADRAPLMLVLVVLSLSFGIIGLVSNHFLGQLLPPLVYVWLSMALAMGGGLLISRTFARTFARVLPRMETYALQRCDCVGQTGTITGTLSDGGAYAQVYDPNHNLLEVHVHGSPGTKFELGNKVLFLDYDESLSLYLAEPIDAHPDARPLAEPAPAHARALGRQARKHPGARRVKGR